MTSIVFIGMLFAAVTPGRDVVFAKGPPAIRETVDRESGIVHPGIGFNKAQLETIVRNVRGGVEPWKRLYGELSARDNRFSKHPRIFTDRRVPDPGIGSPDFDNRCEWDSETAVGQSLMYLITGEECYRSNALEIVRWFSRNVKRGWPHWDSQFRWPYAEHWYVAAAELLRYTGPVTGPLAWTDEDTRDVDRFIKIGENMWWGRGMLCNQLQWALGGPLARAVWRNDRALYDESVEILTANRLGPVGQCNGSIKEMCRLVVSNEVTGAAVTPHVQFSEMGRDIGHSFPGAGALAENLAILMSQGTKVDPVTGETSKKKNAVEPIEYLDHRFLRGVNQICKYNLGFDIDWTPIYINRGKNELWTCPSNWGGGRGRIVDTMDLLYNYYRWKRGVKLERGEDARYLGYANRLRGWNACRAFFWMPAEAAGKWRDERIDPGRENTIHFTELIQPKERPNPKDYIVPVFLPFRFPLTKPGEYTLRYRTDGEARMAIIDPQDYATEFEDGVAATKRKYVEIVKLPSTDGQWSDFTFKLDNPPRRNLIKLRFATHGKFIEVGTLKAL